MKLSAYIAELMKISFSSSLSLGLVLAVLMLITGNADGSITLDIELSAIDSIWFLLGTPALLSLIFLLVSPLSYFIYLFVFKSRNEKPGSQR
jgi:hypothetical protein